MSSYAACAAFSAFAAAMASMSSLSASVLSAASLATAANRSACTFAAVSGSHVLRPLGGVVLILNFTMSCTLSFLKWAPGERSPGALPASAEVAESGEPEPSQHGIADPLYDLEHGRHAGEQQGADQCHHQAGDPAG